MNMLGIAVHRSPASGTSLFQPRPCRSMIARAVFSAHIPIDTGGCQPRRCLFVEQKVINPQSRISGPTVPEIVPERIHRLLRMQCAEGVGPALLQQPTKPFPGCGLDKRVFVP